jgi:hypothetical protein
VEADLTIAWVRLAMKTRFGRSTETVKAAAELPHSIECQ